MEASIIMGAFDNFYDLFRDELENAIEKFYGILIVVCFVGKGRVGGFDTY